VNKLYKLGVDDWSLPAGGRVGGWGRAAQHHARLVHLIPPQSKGCRVIPLFAGRQTLNSFSVFDHTKVSHVLFRSGASAKVKTTVGGHAGPPLFAGYDFRCQAVAIDQTHVVPHGIRFSKGREEEFYFGLGRWVAAPREAWGYALPYDTILARTIAALFWPETATPPTVRYLIGSGAPCGV
jgi:hypothetical protein